MKELMSLSAFCILLSLSLSEGKVSVYFSESSPGAYLKSTQQSHGALSKDDLITASTSLLNVGALAHVDGATSTKVKLLS